MTTNLTLSEADFATLERAINRVWSGIAYDVQEFEPMTKRDRLEMCVDAGRLRDLADDPEADDLFQALCQRHTYIAVTAALLDRIHLGY